MFTYIMEIDGHLIVSSKYKDRKICKSVAANAALNAGVEQFAVVDDKGATPYRVTIRKSERVTNLRATSESHDVALLGKLSAALKSLGFPAVLTEPLIVAQLTNGEKNEQTILKSVLKSLAK